MKVADRFRKRSWLKAAVWAVCILAFLFACSWLLVPPIVKSQAERLGSEKLGRKLSIGHIDFKPWTLELTVDDIALAGLAPGSQQLQIKRVYLNAALQSLVKLRPVLDAITIEQPRFALTHLGGGRYDIDDILTRFKPTPDDSPSGDPLSFALYNLTLVDGSIDFTDKTVDRTHTVRGLRIGVPFVSNLPAVREVKVEPRLALQLNGSAFDSAAQTTPFTDDRKTDVSLKIAKLDLAPYLGYIPTGLPIEVRAAVLDVDLALRFVQTPKVTVQLKGHVEASGLQVADSRHEDLLRADSIKVVLDDVRPLDRVVKLGSVDVAGLQLDVRRGADGRLNLGDQGAAAGPAAAGSATSEPAASAPASAPAKAPTKAQAAKPEPWQFELAKLALRDGAVRWTDQAANPGAAPAALALQGLTLDLSELAFPFAHPFKFGGAARVESFVSIASDKGEKNKAGKLAPETTLAFSGSATDKAAEIQAKLEHAPLSLASSYMAAQLAPPVGGDLSADVEVQWKADEGAVINLKQVTLDGFAMRVGAGVGQPSRKASDAVASLPSVRSIRLSDARVDLQKRTVHLAKLSFDQPRATVERTADGQWMYERWLKPAPASTVPKAAKQEPAPTEKPWGVTLGELRVEGGTVAYRDQAQPQPVSADFSGIQLQVGDFSSDGAKPVSVRVSTRIAAGETEPGRADFRGQIVMKPLTVQGQVEIAQLPLHAFEPYFGDALNLDLARADTSFKGSLRYADAPAGPTVKVNGDVAIEEFRARNPIGAEATPGVRGQRELLSWKGLSLRGVDVSLAPGVATAVEVKETALSDFYARVIVDETGRINLQDLVKSSAKAAPAAATAATAASAPASAPAIAASNAPAAVATAAQPAAAKSGPEPNIRFGPISLLNGRVLFSDRFVKPNYTANLTELTGKLSAFASAPAPSSGAAPTQAPALADLELRGRAEGTASLEITGKLNPLAKPLALDIHGKVRDLELPPLSPYTIKYAGHGVERGKMSVDVHYEIQPNGQLTATNSLVLNQLTFGEPVAGAPASLPVKLAVALLADRNGVIDLKLPISGSLNDPQFSIGPVIFKIIVNLVAKAVTSPFSLLASAFGGGGEELGVIPFPAGSAALTPEAEEQLNKVAKALTDRPALKMSVVGTGSLEAEAEAFKRERLKRMVVAEKRRSALASAPSAAPPSAVAVSGPPNVPTAALTVTDGEYPELLKSIYKRAEFGKPRNAIGLVKDIPLADMEALLLANMAVTADSIHQLGVQRGVAVRDYLAGRQVALDRLFLGAPKAVPSDGKWSPHADLTLAIP